MNKHIDEAELEQDEYLSRSEKKRRSTARQKIGEELGNMPISAVKSFGLSKELEAAFCDFQAMTKHEARRRQMQYIGRLLREEDVTALEQRLHELHEGRAAAAADFHHLEQLRDKLMEHDDAIGDVLSLYPSADLQRMRQLIRNARKERAAEKPAKSFRLLFRYLRELEENK